jgi:hypothetical protein
MVSKARTERLDAERELLESAYLEALKVALDECAAGKWGLFGQNDGLLPRHLEERWRSDSCRKLDVLGEELSSLRSRLGYHDDFWPVKRLKQLRAGFHSKTLGEAKLAAAFINELKSSK